MAKAKIVEIRIRMDGPYGTAHLDTLRGFPGILAVTDEGENIIRLDLDQKQASAFLAYLEGYMLIPEKNPAWWDKAVQSSEKDGGSDAIWEPN